MADEIRKAYTAGLTNVYAVVNRPDPDTDDTWQPWDVTNSEFTNWNGSNISDYAIDMSESVDGLYSADFPVAITTAATYVVTIYSGDKSAPADTVVDSIEIVWNGSSEIETGADSGQLTTLTTFKEYYGL